MKLLVGIISFIITTNIFAAGTGRFQITDGGSAVDKVMIDTQTGKLWKLRCAATGPGNECAFYAWVEETVEGISIAKQDFANLVQRIEKSANKQSSN